jgi:hypothetical protein
MAVRPTASSNVFRFTFFSCFGLLFGSLATNAGIGKTERRPYVGMVETGFNADHFDRGNRGPVR